MNFKFIDPNTQQNADNLEAIAKLVKPHWSLTPIFWMTLAILLMAAATTYFSYASYVSSRSIEVAEPEAVTTTESRYELKQKPLALPSTSGGRP